MAFKSQPTVTRPANTTAYTAGDVVGGAYQLSVPAGNILLTSCGLQINVTAVPSGMTSFRRHFYNITPPSAIADNAAWTLHADDLAYYLGYVDVGSPADGGSALYSQVDQVNMHLFTQTQNGLFCYEVTNGGFTPAGNSEVYRPFVHGIQL